MGKHTYFTTEQEQWLRENYRNAPTYQNLTLCFNEKFSTARSVSMIREKCIKRLGLKGMQNPSKYGIKQKEQLPVGTIRKSQNATYIKVKLAFNADMTGYQEPFWLPLQKKIYQDAYGEINPGFMVCFLDGNHENFSLDNLYPIDRKISAVMSKNGWWTDNKELTLAAIRWCELYYAIKSFQEVSHGTNLVHRKA